jgi:hypothetical protein
LYRKRFFYVLFCGEAFGYRDLAEHPLFSFKEPHPVIL